MRFLPKMLFIAMLITYIAAEIEPRKDRNRLPDNKGRKTKPLSRKSTLRPKPTKPTFATRKPQPNHDNENYNCAGNYLTVKERKAITNKHNELRSQMAKGKAMNKDGKYMPSGRNIYALTYNCTLEKQAQAWVNYCKKNHSPQQLRPDTGENIYWYGETTMKKKRFKNVGVEATESWWSELKDSYADNPSNIVNNKARNSGIVNHFLTMARGKTTAIGCGKAICPGSDFTYVFVVCHYYVRGAWTGEEIYEPGSPCRKNKDCDTYPGSKCWPKKGLCLKK